MPNCHDSNRIQDFILTEHNGPERPEEIIFGDSNIEKIGDTYFLNKFSVLPEILKEICFQHQRDEKMIFMAIINDDFSEID